MGGSGGRIVNNCRSNEKRQDKSKQVAMKFLVIVLVIRFIIQLVSNKRNNTNTNDAGAGKVKIFHPAEFGLR